MAGYPAPEEEFVHSNPLVKVFPGLYKSVADGQVYVGEWSVTLPPVCIAKVPLTVAAVPKSKAPYVSILLKVVVPLMEPLPENITEPVLADALNVPLLVKLPPEDMVRLFEPVITKLPLEAIVTELATALVVCMLMVELAGIITSVDVVGTPPHQLLALFQSPEVPPTHWPFAATITEIMVLIWAAQEADAFTAYTLKLVFAKSVPDEKLIVPPVPEITEPIVALVVLFLN